MDLGRRLFIGISLLQVFVIHVDSHGSLIDPAARNQANKLGGIKSTPRNTDPNALNCGGLNTQWNTYGGKCGTCGDKYGSNGDHESLQGKYVKNSAIVKTYTEEGILDATVLLTAAHKGWFEFRLCKLDKTKGETSRTKQVTQECLDENLLTAATDSSKTRFLLADITPTDRKYSISLRLPNGLYCDACVLQWWYKAGNNWNTDRQETFVNCADIAITPTNKPNNENPTYDNAPNGNTNDNKASYGNVDLDSLLDVEQKQLDVLLWSARLNKRMSTFLKTQLMPTLGMIEEELEEIKESMYKK